MNKVKHLYADGGVIWSGSPGGSAIGGTWAFVATDENDEYLFSDSGYIKVESPKGTTNNHTEFVAAVMALEAMELGWSGILASDSKITLGRLFNGDNTKNLPNEWIERAKEALKRVGAITPKHLDGHATEKQLKAGFGKHGNPVSKWNNECDKLCNKAKEPYKMEKK
jgi:ribonuclease HI